MAIIENTAKSILRKRKRIDSWFISCYGLNLYRGCLHNCTYCDGRAEKYRVEGDFGKDITVKTNAIEILKRELDPARKRKPFRKCYLMMGGGVGDSYQPEEKDYQLTRSTLELMEKFGHPVHILTKSTLVERDLDILERIHEKAGVLVSFSFSSVSDTHSAIFEPGVPLPSQRLESLQRIKSRGLPCGMFLMPVIPFITDTPPMIDAAVKSCRDLNLDYIIFSGMTMKPGRQQDYFLENLDRHFPGKQEEYFAIYQGNEWGEATPDYFEYIHNIFNSAISRYKTAPRIPASIFKNILSENDNIIIILEQLDYLCRLKQRPSPFLMAARSINNIEEPLSTMRKGLRNIHGVGKITFDIIQDILDRGYSKYYEKMLYSRY